MRRGVSLEAKEGINLNLNQIITIIIIIKKIKFPKNNTNKIT